MQLNKAWRMANSNGKTYGEREMTSFVQGEVQSELQNLKINCYSSVVKQTVVIEI